MSRYGQDHQRERRGFTSPPSPPTTTRSNGADHHDRAHGFAAEMLALPLSEFRSDWLVATCSRCGHSDGLALCDILRNQGGHHTLGAVVARLHCSDCGEWQPGTVELDDGREVIPLMLPGWSEAKSATMPKRIAVSVR